MALLSGTTTDSNLTNMQLYYTSYIFIYDFATMPFDIVKVKILFQDTDTDTDIGYFLFYLLRSRRTLHIKVSMGYINLDTGFYFVMVALLLSCSDIGLASWLVSLGNLMPLDVYVPDTNLVQR